jgi:hypothetical protein
METPRSPTDPLTIVRDLDAEAIRQRIDELDAERQALMVLLRAAQRMERADQRKLAARPERRGQVGMDFPLGVAGATPGNGRRINRVRGA